MIKFTAPKKNGGTIIGLGLEEGNIERLKKGQPMLVDLSELGIESVEILVTYGKDQETIKADLRKAGMTGI